MFIAAAVAMILAMGTWTLEQRVLLIGLALIHVHFFEEFGFPGGFIWGGLKVELHHVDADVRKWPLNQLSSWWGNEWFAVAVYLLPLFTPRWHWAVLAAVVFAYLEFVMHVIVFNLGLHSWYNPGLVSAVGGLTVVSTWYLMQVVPTHYFNWLDLLMALAWIGINYWLAFKSPICRMLTAQTRYRFSKQDIQKAQRYIDRFPDEDFNQLHHFANSQEGD
ncbi:HXXEE domain-containing protein [Levilactobacillus acidifarinae]